MDTNTQSRGGEKHVEVRQARGGALALLSLAAVGGIIHEMMRDDRLGLPY
jgi:hypothetical protein